MRQARSIIFAAVALLWTVVLSVAFLPVMLTTRRLTQRCSRLWCRGLLWLAKVICGVRHRIDGMENLPDGPAIIAAKHQSAWETLFFHSLLDDPVYILKTELIDNLLIGRYLKKAGNIPIDRAAGARALKPMIAAVGERLAEGAQVIIFPEGTRVAPGNHQPYQPGIAALYSRYGSDVSIIPLAHNSGMFWQRWTKEPGEIAVSVLPPLPIGLGRRQMLAELERRIEDETQRLVAAPAVENAGSQLQGTRG